MVLEHDFAAGAFGIGVEHVVATSIAISVDPRCTAAPLPAAGIEGKRNHAGAGVFGVEELQGRAVNCWITRRRFSWSHESAPGSELGELAGLEGDVCHRHLNILRRCMSGKACEDEEYGAAGDPLVSHAVLPLVW